MIHLDNSSFYYQLFNQLALVLAFIIFIWYNKKRGFRFSQLFTYWAGVICCAMLGSKWATYSIGDWQQIYETGSFLHTSARTSLGFFVGLLIGGVLFCKVLKFRLSILDALAWALPAGLIFQRIGCLLGGCCYGTPTDIPWGISYANDFIVYQYHYVHRLIDFGADQSHLVHPAQVYSIIAYISILFILTRWEKYFSVAGNLFLASLTLLLAFRFGIEFFRDPITNHQLGHFVGGLKIVQWILFGLVITFSTLILYRTKQKRISTKRRPSGMAPSFIVLLFISTLVTVANESLLPNERNFILGCLLLAHISLGFSFIKRVKINRSYQASLSIWVFLFILFTSQTFSDSFKKQNPDGVIKKRELLIDASTYTGTIKSPSNGCSVYEPGFVYSYGSIGVGFTLKEYYRFPRYATATIKAFTGWQNFDPLDGMASRGRGAVNISGGQIGAAWEGKGIGFGVGSYIGKVGLLGLTSGIATVNNNDLGVVPYFHIRFGKRERLFFESGFLNGEAGPFASTFNWMMGYGFDRTDGTRIRIGYALEGPRIDAAFLLPDSKILFSPGLIIGQNTRQLLLGIRYNIY